MTSSIRKALLYKRAKDHSLSHKKICYGNVLFNGISESAVKIFQLNPLKVPALKRSTKGLMAGAYRRATWTKRSLGKTTTER